MKVAFDCDYITDSERTRIVSAEMFRLTMFDILDLSASLRRKIITPMRCSRGLSASELAMNNVLRRTLENLERDTGTIERSTDEEENNHHNVEYQRYASSFETPEATHWNDSIPPTKRTPLRTTEDTKHEITDTCFLETLEDQSERSTFPQAFDDNCNLHYQSSSCRTYQYARTELDRFDHR